MGRVAEVVAGRIDEKYGVQCLKLGLRTLLHIYKIHIIHTLGMSELKTTVAESTSQRSFKLGRLIIKPSKLR